MMRQYGLIGKSLEHSYSPGHFAKKFADENIRDVEYLAIPLEEAADILHLVFRQPELLGLNVTIPYKEEVIPYLDSLDPSAKAVGAVNTIRIEHTPENIRLNGYNTDVAGFRDSLKPLLKDHHTKALVLGTGGASKAICFVLGKLDIDFQLVSRSSGRNQIRYRDLTEEVIAEHKLIVNTTPVGTWPDDDLCPDIPYGGIGDHHLLYDLVYNPSPSLFLRKGTERGATIKDGLEMLQIQAEASWKLWNRGGGLMI